MVFITLWEIIDIIIMTLAIGFIFSGYVKIRPNYEEDPIKHYQRNSIVEDIKIGAMVAAPAVVLHEMAHKIAALAVGASTATIHAPSFFFPYDMYIAIVLLKLIGSPIIFFIGGYVIHDAAAGFPGAIVSAAGPLTNFLLYFVCLMIIKFRLVKPKFYGLVSASGKLNLFLGGFNLIPLFGFDGAHIIQNLLVAFGL